MQVKFNDHFFKGEIPRIEPKWLVENIPGARLSTDCVVTVDISDSLKISFCTVDDCTSVQAYTKSSENPEKIVQNFTKLPIHLKYMNTMVHYDKPFANGEITFHTINNQNSRC